MQESASLAGWGGRFAALETPDAGQDTLARYDLVIFDFDGTLADSLTWFRSVLGDVVDKHGLPPVDDEEAERLRGLPPRAIMDELDIPAWKIPFLAADVRARAAENVDQIHLFDGICSMIEMLAAGGVKLAIVSSNGETAVRAVLGDALCRHIEIFACGAALFGKASVFRRTIRKTGITPARALSVGDEVRDIDAAREAGCAAGAVSWGFATEAILAEQAPDAMFRAPGEIADCVLSAQPRVRQA